LMTGSCLLLGFGPLAFGAVQGWAIYVLQSGASLLFLIWATRELVQKKCVFLPHPLFMPAAAFALLVVIQLSFSLSAYCYASWERALLWAAYGMILFVVAQTFRRNGLLRWGYLIVTSYGFLVAVFAITQQITWNGKVYWVVANTGGGAVYGPYIDHAHYAGLMEMLIPVPMVFAMTVSASRPLRALALFAAVIMVSSVFLSQSLGGIVALSAELAVLLALSLLRRKSYSGFAIIALLCILLGVSLAALHPSGLSERLRPLRNPLHEGGMPGRLAILTDGIKMVHQHPIFGWGLGTFPIVYPSFQSFYSEVSMNEAHDDFLQILVETGLAGFAIAGMFLITLYRHALANIHDRRDDSQAGMSLAALTACTGLLVHCLCDFNLQIPANAALFFSCATLAARPRYFPQMRGD
jgi:O-antigen ligase